MTFELDPKNEPESFEDLEAEPIIETPVYYDLEKNLGEDELNGQ